MGDTITHRDEASNATILTWAVGNYESVHSGSSRTPGNRENSVWASYCRSPMTGMEPAKFKQT